VSTVAVQRLAKWEYVVVPYICGVDQNSFMFFKTVTSTTLFLFLFLFLINRIIKSTLGDAPKCAFPRTLLDLTKKNWADAFDKAFLAYNGKKLSPPFDPYEDSLKYLISTYFIPYVGLTGYVGASPLLTGYNGKKVSLSFLPFALNKKGKEREERRKRTQVLFLT